MAGNGQASLDQNSLFFTLAEDLKTPLLRIAYTAELAASDTIHTTAVEALKLIDAYLLGVRSQTQFELEPVNPSAVLYDVAHELSALARRSDCELSVHAPAHLGSALVHRAALLASLRAIGTVFIEAQSILGDSAKRVELAVYKTSKGLSVGVFQPHTDAFIDAQLFSRAHAHVGTASRPFAGLASGASAQLFVAEQLLAGMQARLRSAHRGSLAGLAADLARSNQLSLV